MGKTYKHTIVAKFKQGLIALKDIPENVYNMWNRHNNDWGEFRAKKKSLIEKEHGKRTKFTK